MCRSTVQGRHLISDDNGNTPAPFVLHAKMIFPTNAALSDNYLSLIKHYPSQVMYALHFQSIHGLTAAQQQGTAFPASELTIFILPYYMQNSNKTGYPAKPDISLHDIIQGLQS